MPAVSEISPGLLAFLLAFGATGALLVILLKRAHRLPVDRPNERSLHQSPTPRIGGLAAFPGLVFGTAVGGETSPVWMLLGLSAFLFVLSIADDWRSLPASVRFGGHLTAAGIFAFGVAASPLLALAGIFAMTWMTNLFNFMDGANGLAGGMTAIGFAVLAIATGDGTLAWAVVGAALAFLGFNFDPARVFLGDAGSVPIGFIAGGLSFIGVASGRWPLWFPLLVFAPFVIDATATLLRRMLRKERFWAAHREHYYQRLIRLGWTHRRLATAEYALMICSGGLALVLLPAPLAWQALGVAACLAVHLALMLWIDRRWHASGEAA